MLKDKEERSASRRRNVRNVRRKGIRMWKKPIERPSWDFCVACLIILSSTAAVHAHFAGEAERAFETADLQTMLLAETAAKAESLEVPNGTSEYWYDAERNELIPTSEPKPAPYGFGTKIDGDAFRNFAKAKKFASSYDERKNYENEVLLVSVDESSGRRLVKTTWIDAD